MIYTEIRFIDNMGYNINKTLKGDRINDILERLKVKKTKTKIDVLLTYNDKDFSTIREVILWKSQEEN